MSDIRISGLPLHNGGLVNERSRSFIRSDRHEHTIRREWKVVEEIPVFKYKAIFEIVADANEKLEGGISYNYSYSYTNDLQSNEHEFTDFFNVKEVNYDAY